MSVLLCSKWLVNFKGRDCISHVLQCLAGIYKRVDRSCKRRTKYLSCSFVILQAPFIWEKSAYLVEVSVMKQILWKFPNSNKSWGNWACANSVYQAFFPSAHALEPGTRVLVVVLIHAYSNCGKSVRPVISEGLRLDPSRIQDSLMFNILCSSRLALLLLLL